MQDNEVYFTQDIYSEHLTTINGVNFTPREIDVISCLLNARRTNQIASILSIAPRTVTTHFRNIMLRLDCNSQEGIISFIERSGKLSILREYYASLVIESAFEKALKEISKLKCEKNLADVIVYWKDSNLKNALIRHLNNHLNQAGINVEIREQGIDRKLENVRNPIHAHLLLVEKKDHPGISQEPVDFNSIDLSKYQNYYFSVFEIIKKLLLNVKLETIIANFRNQYDGMQGSSKSKNSMTYQVGDLEKDEEKIFHKTIEIFKSRKWYFVSTLFVMCLLGSGFLAIKENKGQEQSQSRIQDQYAKQEKKEENAIRSDLIIPTETALLHRPELIAQIDEKFKGQNGIQTVALVGIGGAGKTTTARQYARSQKSPIVWEINAETKGSLISSFETLASALAKTVEDKKILRRLQDIKNAKERNEKIFSFVIEKLKLHSNWFLVYDNVEKFVDIQKYFPHDQNVWGTGKIILTTRDSNIQNNNHINNSIQIGELAPKEKLNLFISIIGNKDAIQFTAAQKEEAKKFLDNIPSFPLDISIAACYLKTANITYAMYLEYLNGNNKDFAILQENVFKEASDYTKTRYNIITLSLEKLIATHKDFKDLLLFISLVDSQNIPRELLDTYKSSVIVDNFLFNLKKYSLITNESSSYFQQMPAFSLHRSTQEISLKYLTKSLNLEKHNQLLQSIAQSLDNYIADAIHEESFPRMRLLLSHCEVFVRHNDLLSDIIIGAMEGKIGCIYYGLGNYKKALNLIKVGFEKLNRPPIRNYAKIAELLLYLGNVHRELGNYETAINLIELSLTNYKKQLPENHIDIIWASVYLGNVYRKLGKYEKAKQLLEQSLFNYKKQLPERHVKIARTLAYLANVYRNLGEYERARSLLEQSLIIYEENFSKNHPRVAWVLACLGDTHRELGNYEKSKDLLEKSLLIYKKILSDHGMYVWVLVYLGNVHRELGNYEKAKDLLEQSLLIYKGYYPENHIDIAWALICLGNIYSSLKDYEKAKNLLRQGLITYENNYGKNHIETARALKDLGLVYLLENQLETAEQLMMKALVIFRQNTYRDSYVLLENLTELCLKKSLLAKNKENIQQFQNLKRQAIAYLKQALIIVRDNFPENSPHTVRIQDKLKAL